MKSTILTDTELLNQLHAGDTTSFDQLYQRHYNRVYEVLFRLLGNAPEAEDVAQQVFIKLYHQAPTADKDSVNLVGWLYRVAMNEGYNTLRQQKRRKRWQERFSKLWSFVMTSPEQVVEVQDTQSRVRAVLATMKPRQVKLLLLRHSGLSYKELAIALEVAPGSIGSLLTRAERSFAKKYQQMFGTER